MYRAFFSALYLHGSQQVQSCNLYLMAAAVRACQGIQHAAVQAVMLSEAVKIEEGRSDHTWG